MQKFAIIVAGGAGTRMGAPVPKQFLLLGGQPLFLHSVQTFLEAYADLRVILVLPEDHLHQGVQALDGKADTGRCRIVAGGGSRFHSVQNGLRCVPDDAVIFVHDAVRCLVGATLIARCYDVAVVKGNAVPAVPATDSLRLETESGSQPLDRSKIRLIQTPQTFQASQLHAAFKQPYHPSFTDEATAVESTGIAINLVEGDPFNIKITTPLDMAIAAGILANRSS